MIFFHAIEFMYSNLATVEFLMKSRIPIEHASWIKYSQAFFIKIILKNFIYIVEGQVLWPSWSSGISDYKYSSRSSNISGIIRNINQFENISKFHVWSEISIIHHINWRVSIRTKIFLCSFIIGISTWLVM